MKHLLFLDIETTGLNAEKDELIELSALRLSPDAQKEIATFDELVQPTSNISPFITRLTGISNTMVSEARTLEEVHADFARFLQPNDIICGHNILFDIRFLRAKGFEINNEHLDTFPLANILLPDEPSYSLEVLTKRLNIEHSNAHRAMADVRANADLFKEMLERAKKLDEKLKREYEAILEKSMWTGKMLFSVAFSQEKEREHPSPQASLFDTTHSSENEEKMPAHSQEITPTLQNKKAVQILEEMFDKPDNQGMLALPAEVDETGVAALHAKKYRQTHPSEKIFCAPATPTLARNTPEGFFRFAAPNKVLCERAFSQWIQKKITLSEVETVAAMKTVREKHMGNSLIIGDLPLMREEWNIARAWMSAEHVRCSSTCPAKKMQLDAARKHLFFCHVQDVGVCPATKGIVLHGERLAESIEASVRETISIRHIKTMLEAKKMPTVTDDIFFGIGLLERYIREHVGESPYREYFPLRKEMQDTAEINNLSTGFFEAAKACAQHFPDDTELVRALKHLARFLSDEISENEYRFFTIYQDDGVFATRTSISLIPAFQALFEKKEKVIFTGKTFLQKGGKYFFGEGLPSPEQQKTLKSTFQFSEKALFLIPSFGGNGKTSTSEGTQTVVEGILPILNGNLLVLFPGGSIAEHFTENIQKKATEYGFQVLGIYGSAGKLQEQMREKKSLVVATASTWEKIDFARLSFSGCVQHRLLFAPPGDPAAKERQKESDNFLDIALPKVVQKTHALLNGLMMSGNRFFWLCLDAHFQKQGNFTEEILASLPATLPVHAADIREMPKKVANFLAKEDFHSTP